MSKMKKKRQKRKKKNIKRHNVNKDGAHFAKYPSLKYESLSLRAGFSTKYFFLLP